MRVLIMHPALRAIRSEGKVSEPLWLAKAIEHIGTAEISGAANNETIMSFYKACGHNGIEYETTAWCAAFVGACLKRAGKPVAQPVELNLMARSYLKYGTKLAKPVPGCIAVWPRGKPPSGHVGFVVSVDEAKGTIRTVEGNVSDQVMYKTHKITDALGYRWPPEAKQPVIEPPKVTVKDAVAVAAKSQTVWMQVATPVLVVWGYASDGAQWVFDLVLSFTATLPGLATDTETALGTARQFSTWLNLPLAQISLAVVVGFCGFSIFRHVRDKLHARAAP
jgi:uncharacterized protein (TIGR02594 family)